MNGKIFKILTIISIVICCILFIFFCIFKFNRQNKQSKKDQVNEKIIEEIKYYEINIISAINKLNKISISRYKVNTEKIDVSKDQNSESDKTSSSTDSQDSDYSDKEESVTISKSSQVDSLNNDGDNINWDDISYIYDNLYLTWPTISTDIKYINIDNELISNMGVNLDGIAQSIKSKDKISCMINLANLYSEFPKVIESISNSNNYLNLYNAKLALLNSYVLVTQDNWKNVLEFVETSKFYMNEIIRTSENNENSKISNMLEDLKNCIQIADKDIFFMKYKNIIQQMESLVV